MFNKTNGGGGRALRISQIYNVFTPRVSSNRFYFYGDLSNNFTLGEHFLIVNITEDNSARIRNCCIAK